MGCGSGVDQVGSRYRVMARMRILGSVRAEVVRSWVKRGWIALRWGVRLMRPAPGIDIAVTVHLMSASEGQIVPKRRHRQGRRPYAVQHEEIK